MIRVSPVDDKPVAPFTGAWIVVISRYNSDHKNYFLIYYVHIVFTEKGSNYNEFQYGFYYIFNFLNIVVVAPIGEELLFRKILYIPLIEKYKNIANLIQAVVFSILHFDILSFPTHLISGYILGWVYHKKKTIAAPIVLHSLLNLIAFALIWMFR